MPLVRIDLSKGNDPAYRERIRRVVHEAISSGGIPANAQFEIIGEYDADDFLFDPTCLGLRRGDDLVVIQITLNRGRSIVLQQAHSEPR